MTSVWIWISTSIFGRALIRRGPELIRDRPFLPRAIVSQVEINSRPSKLSRFFKPQWPWWWCCIWAVLRFKIFLLLTLNVPPSWDCEQFGSNIFGGTCNIWYKWSIIIRALLLSDKRCVDIKINPIDKSFSSLTLNLLLHVCNRALYIVQVN